MSSSLCTTPMGLADGGVVLVWQVRDALEKHHAELEEQGTSSSFLFWNKVCIDVEAQLLQAGVFVECVSLGGDRQACVHVGFPGPHKCLPVECSAFLPTGFQAEILMPAGYPREVIVATAEELEVDVIGALFPCVRVIVGFACTYVYVGASRICEFFLCICFF